MSRVVLLLSFVASVSSLASAEEPARAIPPEVQRLLEAGTVTLEFYDRRKPSMAYPGQTAFDISVSHRHALRYETKNRGGKRMLEIEQKLESVDVGLKHTLLLPRRLDKPEIWSDRLSRHELDHVAVSSDPRAELLLRHLYEHLPPIEQELAPAQRIDKDMVQKVVNDQLQLRNQAIIELVKWNYALLDRVSSHGNRPIPERAEFFRRLYTKPNLDEAAFSFTGDVLELLKSEPYSNAKPLNVE